MYNFQALTSKDWVGDYGFRKALEANLGTIKYGDTVVGPGRKDIVRYWQEEKSHYALWELLSYMGAHTEAQTLAYFDLPADTISFLKWVHQRVAHGEADRVGELAGRGFFSIGAEQMHYFPYAPLYQLWQQETDAQRQARRGNVLVYLDRLADADGYELLRWHAPTLYE